MKNLLENNKKVYSSKHNSESDHSPHWDPGNNFAYQHGCRCMKSLLENNKQADHPINSSVPFLEGLTAQDTCMNLYKVPDIVLCLDHALRIKKRKSS